jgi:hypothetical protein
MKYYKYATEAEARMASCDIYDLYAWQPFEERQSKYAYGWRTNGTDWVMVVDGTIPTRSVLIGVEWITQEEAEEQGYLDVDEGL